MIKRFFRIGLVLVLLSACANTQNQTTSFDVYQIHYQSILNNPSFKAQSDYFNVEAYIVELSANQYRYDVFIDQPKVAMYDVEVLVIVDDGLLVVSEQMMPSLGVFETSEYNLIPFQVDSARGFYRGLNLNGVVNREPIDVKVLVIWKDYFKIRTFKEYVRFELSTQIIVEEPIVEPEEVVDDEESSDE